MTKHKSPLRHANAYLGERVSSSLVKTKSSGCSGEPSGIVVVGSRSSSKNGCSHACEVNEK